MKKKITIICICSFLLSGLVSGQSKPADKEDQLKENLIKATIKAIEFEMDRNKNNVEKIERLSEEKRKYSNMRKSDYKIPDQIAIESCYVTEELKENGQLYFKKQSRSGPFYCISGIVKDNKKLMKKGSLYSVKAYLVYIREYIPNFKNYYIYIDSAIRKKK